MQKGQPIAYLSKVLKGKALLLSTYEKKLFALETVVQKWRPYVFEQSFMIKIDQQALKYLLDQKIGTVAQRKQLVKLMGYNFAVEYKKRKENYVANALSRKEEGIETADGSQSLITIPNPQCIEELKRNYHDSHEVMELWNKLQKQQPGPKTYTLKQDLILKK